MKANTDELIGMLDMVHCELNANTDELIGEMKPNTDELIGMLDMVTYQMEAGFDKVTCEMKGFLASFAPIFATKSVMKTRKRTVQARDVKVEIPDLEAERSTRKTNTKLNGLTTSIFSMSRMLDAAVPCMNTN